MMGGLDFKGRKPCFKGGRGLTFGVKGKGPNETAIIIYDVHRIQTTGTRGNRHRTAKINVNTLKLF